MLNCMGYKEITCFDPSFKIRFLIEGHIGQGRVVSKPSVQSLIVKQVELELGQWDQKLAGIEGYFGGETPRWLYQWIWG